MPAEKKTHRRTPPRLATSVESARNLGVRACGTLDVQGGGEGLQPLGSLEDDVGVPVLLFLPILLSSQIVSCISYLMNECYTANDLSTERVKKVR